MAEIRDALAAEDAGKIAERAKHEGTKRIGEHGPRLRDRVRSTRSIAASLASGDRHDDEAGWNAHPLARCMNPRNLSFWPLMFFSSCHRAFVFRFGGLSRSPIANRHSRH